MINNNDKILLKKMKKFNYILKLIINSKFKMKKKN